MDLKSLVSGSWDGRLPEAWRWLTRTSLGMTEAGWLDRNVPGWTRGADGLPDDATLRRVADVTEAPDPDSWISGSVLDVGAHLKSSEADQLEDWKLLALGTGVSPATTLMDTTTLYTVYQLLTDDDPRVATPLTVVDLATFLTAFCVYDRICFLQNPYVSAVELNNLFQQEVFCELPVSDTVNDPDISAICGNINEPLKSLYQARAVPWLSELRVGRFGTGEQRDAWVRGWETILGIPCDPDWLLRDPNENLSPRYTDHWDSPAADLLQNIVAVTGGADRQSPGLAVVDRQHVGPERSGRVPLAQESNARAIYNLVLADFLDVPYSASATRLPALHLMLRDGLASMRGLLELPRGAQALNEAFGSKAAHLLTRDHNSVQLPFFPSAILRAARDRHEIAPRAGDIREKGVAFRRGLPELKQRLDEDPWSASADIERMMEPAARDWARLIPVAEAGEVSFDVVFLLQEPHLTALVMLAVLVKGAFSTAVLAEVLRRRARPRYGTFGNLVPVPGIGPDIKRLWNIEDGTWFTQRIHELAVLGESD